MDREIQWRLQWVRRYEESRDAGLVAGVAAYPGQYENDEPVRRQSMQHY